MKSPVLYCDDGEERELPFVWRICGQCEGHGTSSAYLGAFTREDFDEEGPEFTEDYFSGRYDRACETCGGAGKVKEIDRKAMPAADLAAYEEQERDREATDAMERQERLMEGGWREENWFGRG